MQLHTGYISTISEWQHAMVSEEIAATQHGIEQASTLESVGSWKRRYIHLEPC